MNEQFPVKQGTYIVIALGENRIYVNKNNKRPRPTHTKITTPQAKKKKNENKVHYKALLKSVHNF